MNTQHLSEIATELLRLRDIAEREFAGAVNFETGIPEAENILRDLERFPHAFVLAAVMDRQIKARRAWLIPYELKLRLGSFDMPFLNSLSVDDFKNTFLRPPALHRFNDLMAENAFHCIQRVATVYDGDARNIWAGSPSSALIVRRFLNFRGIGVKIATMATNILVRDLQIPVSDRYSIDISPDFHVLRVFSRLGLIENPKDIDELIYTARAMHPEYPGIFDFIAWDIGRTWCHENNPNCSECKLKDVCPSSRAAQQIVGPERGSRVL
jgi:hypothetical protein